MGVSVFFLYPFIWCGECCVRSDKLAHNGVIELNKQERELEKLVKEVESSNVSVPPFFELYTTVFSIAVSVILFMYPNMIYAYPARLYDHMIAIMPQSTWAICFFDVFMHTAVGLLMDKNVLTMDGSVISCVVYPF